MRLQFSEIAKLAQKYELEGEFKEKANRMKKLILERLWDEKDEFFKVLPLESPNDSVATWQFNELDSMKNVREQIGYIPWYFNIPDEGYDGAWKQLLDIDGFYAPFLCTIWPYHC